MTTIPLPFHQSRLKLSRLMHRSLTIVCLASLLGGCATDNQEMSSGNKAAMVGIVSGALAAGIAAAAGADGDTVLAAGATVGILAGTITYIRAEHAISQREAAEAERKVQAYLQRIDSLESEVKEQKKAALYAVKRAQSTSKKPQYILVDAVSKKALNTEVFDESTKQKVEIPTAVEFTESLTPEQRMNAGYATGAGAHGSASMIAIH